MKFENDDSTVNLLKTIKSNIFTTLHVAIIAIVTAINDDIYVCENISTGTIYNTLCAANVEASVNSIVIVLFTDDNYLSSIAVYKSSRNYGNLSSNEQYHNIANGIIIETISLFKNNLSVDATDTVIYNYLTYTLSDDGTYYSVTACNTSASGEITIVDSISNIPVTNIAGGNSTSGSGAFYNCSSITSIVFGSEVATINEYAFQNCTALTEIIIPDTITIIDSNAFRGCTALTSITIGTGVEKIGQYVFRGDSALTAITFIDTENWYKTTSSDYTNGTKADVTDSSVNVTNFISYYNAYYWYKE